MAWNGCLPLFSILVTVLMPLPMIDGNQHTNHPWKCFQCQPGHFVIQDCNSFMSTQCAPCPAGTFTSSFNRLFQCKRCSDCPAGYRQVASCNQAHDTKCVLSPLLKKIHDTAGYQGDEHKKPEGHVTESPIDNGSGDLADEKESRFSSAFRNKKVGFANIPDLSKVEKSEEANQEELSGDTPMKPMLFDLDSFLPRQVERNTSVRSSTEEPSPTTISVSTNVTTDLLPDNEAAIDDLIRIEETKAGAQMTTAAVDTGAEGSAIFTLSLEDLPEVSTETPLQTDAEAGTSLEPETESSLGTTSILTTTLGEQFPDMVTKAIVDTFNEINEPIKPSMAVTNASETVVVETTAVVTSAATSTTNAAPVEVTTTSAETTVASTTEKPAIVPEVDSESESEDNEESESDSHEETETMTSSTVTKSDAVVTSTSASASDASTTNAVPTTTVLLKRIIVPEGDTIDEDLADRNKTPIAKVIPLEKAKEHLTTTGLADTGSTSKETGTFTPAGAPAIPTDITTPQHTYPWINGSELLQKPAVDNTNGEDNKHLDVAIAAVITGIGLIVLAVIAVRYCVKKRTFKDMRRAQDRLRIQINEAKGLKRKDSQTEEALQTAINDDIELQAINGGAKHLNGKANGHCKDANGSAGNGDIMSAVNCNYKPSDDAKTQSNVTSGDSAPVGDLYAVPNKLVVREPAEPLLNDKSKSSEKGETTATPGSCLDILDHLKYIDETTDEEGDYVLQQSADDVYSSAEDLLLHPVNNDLDAIAEESTPMLRRTTDEQS